MGDFGLVLLCGGEDHLGGGFSVEVQHGETDSREELGFPFFLPTWVYKVEKRREPSSFFQPNKDATANCCHGKRWKGRPAHFPFECLRKRSKKAMN